MCVEHDRPSAPTGARGLRIARSGTMAVVLLTALVVHGQDIHFTPTRHFVVEAMLELARVTADDIVYDLGSGDGRIVIIAAQQRGARGVGIESNPRLVGIARQNAREAGVAELVTFVEADLFTADISPATVVTLYLSTSINRQLEPKLRRELRPGSRIVSHQFPIGGWAPDAKIRPDFSDLYLWTVPPR